MSYKLKQGDAIATLNNLDYSPADGVMNGVEAYVIEESLSADSTEILQDGEAELMYKAQTYKVVVTVMEYEDDEEEDVDEDDDEPPACEILIDFDGDGGLEKLAQDLELI